jgi:alpha-galactosidase/6-phospho-beta-glucosidase family protein
MARSNTYCHTVYYTVDFVRRPLCVVSKTVVSKNVAGANHKSHMTRTDTARRDVELELLYNNTIAEIPAEGHCLYRAAVAATKH